MKPILVELHTCLIALADSLTNRPPRPPLLPVRHPPTFARLRVDVAADTVVERLATLIEEGVTQYESAKNDDWPGSVRFRGSGPLPRDCALNDSFEDCLGGFLTSDVLARYRAALSGQLEPVNVLNSAPGIKHAEELAVGKFASGRQNHSSVMYREIAAGIHPQIYAAYVAIAVNYLAEVLDLMPKYAEDSGQGKRRDPITINTSHITTIGEVHNSSVSIADTVTNIGTTIQAVAAAGHTTTADAIRALTEAIEQDPDLAEDDRGRLLDHVADVADAAAAPDEPRRLSRAKAAMKEIAEAAGSSAQLAQAVSTWHNVLGQLF
ncbi:hypothetical protein ACFYOT_41300 [Saccharothrix saharensis]|uniref:hypothetical protein n=1 Tax=Saccharothrix saharensis TaxID=571190 RepID=UPI00369DC120